MSEPADLLARQGFAVYILHYFDRTGTVFADQQIIFSKFPLWMKTLWDAISHVEKQACVDPNRIGLLGFSLGAYLSLSDATIDKRIKAVVDFFGGLPKESDDRIVSKDIAGAREMVRDGIGELREYARPAGMPLAIEPLHPMYAADRSCVNTLAHANDLCDELGDGVGIAVDVYHVWWDPNLEREIERAGGHAGRLLAYHICDWLVPTTDLLLDRGMMGDGVIDLPRIRSWMQAAGYRGPHEVEIFSANNWWKRDPDEVLTTCIDRHRTVC